MTKQKPSREQAIAEAAQVLVYWLNRGNEAPEENATVADDEPTKGT